MKLQLGNVQENSSVPNRRKRDCKRRQNGAANGVRDDLLQPAGVVVDSFQQRRRLRFLFVAPLLRGPDEANTGPLNLRRKVHGLAPDIEKTPICLADALHRAATRWLGFLVGRHRRGLCCWRRGEAGATHQKSGEEK
jgi:hypothetical protein